MRPSLRHLGENLYIDVENGCLYKDDKPLTKGPQLALFLKALYEMKEKHTKPEDLKNLVWHGFATVGSPYTAKKTLNNLFEECGIQHLIFIESSKWGYRLICNVAAVNPQPSDGRNRPESTGERSHLEQTATVPSSSRNDLEPTLPTTANNGQVLIAPLRLSDSLSPRKRQRLAEDFINGLRHRRWTGYAFETRIGPDTMERIRKGLSCDDTEFLIDLMSDTGEHPEIRNRATSLLFGPRLDSRNTKLVADIAYSFYERRVSSDPWQVLRGIALALADQANVEEAICDWISRLRQDNGLLEANLRKTDAYYGDRYTAIMHYTIRVRDYFWRWPAGRLWEVFYLGRRAVPGDNSVIAVLKECSSTPRSALKVLCDESLTLLSPPSGSDIPHYG